MKEKRFVNLTAGLEFIDDLPEYEYVRLQSSLLEAKNWDRFIYSLDDNFLMCLALGHRCYFYDTSARKKLSRAIFQGLELIKYFTEKYWYENTEYIPRIKGINVDKYFKTIRLSRQSRNKLKYFSKFIVGHYEIIPICKKSKYDGKQEKYQQLLKAV